MSADRYRADLYELQRVFKKKFRGLTGTAARYDPRGAKEGGGGGGGGAGGAGGVAGQPGAQAGPGKGGKGGMANGGKHGVAEEENNGAALASEKKRKRPATPGGGQQPPESPAEAAREEQPRAPGSAKKGTPGGEKALTPKGGDRTPASLLLAERLVRRAPAWRLRSRIPFDLEGSPRRPLLPRTRRSLTE